MKSTAISMPIDPRELEARAGSGYPAHFAKQVLPREKRALGDAAGLTKIGVNLTTLWPGAASSMRHWHTHEDEFVYVLQGELLLRTNGGEQLLSAGMCAGFVAGTEDGHQFVNRSDRPASYLVISNRDPQDTAYYADADVDLMWSPPHARGKMTRGDGTPL